MPRHVDIPADWYKKSLIGDRLTPCGKTTMSGPYASDGFVSLWTPGLEWSRNLGCFGYNY